MASCKHVCEISAAPDAPQATTETPAKRKVRESDCLNAGNAILQKAKRQKFGVLRRINTATRPTGCSMDNFRYGGTIFWNSSTSGIGDSDRYRSLCYDSTERKVLFC